MVILKCYSKYFLHVIQVLTIGYCYLCVQLYVSCILAVWKHGFILQPVSWKSVGVTVVVGAVFTAAMLHFKKEKELSEFFNHLCVPQIL
jgi:membrane associated rhomboid family serine protease